MGKQEIKSKLMNIVKKFLRKIFGIHNNQSLSLSNFLKNKRLKYGPYIWKDKFDVKDLVNVMQSLGMKAGSNVFIHCNWNEFYNFQGTERELIDGVLEVIGKDGTLIMPAYPLLRKGKIFNVNKSVTAAGMFAEEFRNYPGVKRSINIQHSVSALGPQSDYLTSEHHLSETCWDEKSPYYKLAEINALVFGLGLGKYYFGTMTHCVESVLRKSVPYFSDFYDKNKTIHQYIDIDGSLKEYSCYDLKKTLRRVNKFRASKKFAKKYFNDTDYGYSQISNLTVAVSKANIIIPKLIALGRKGKIMYSKPGKRGYKFEK